MRWQLTQKIWLSPYFRIGAGTSIRLSVQNSLSSTRSQALSFVVVTCFIWQDIVLSAKYQHAFGVIFCDKTHGQLYIRLSAYIWWRRKHIGAMFWTVNSQRSSWWELQTWDPKLLLHFNCVYIYIIAKSDCSWSDQKTTVISTQLNRCYGDGTTWWCHQMETFSALLATQRPVTRSFHVYFDMHPNKRLSKQLWGWWFET